MTQKAFYSDLKLGVLGGGQLGRMMIQDAIDLNIDISVIDPDENAPCKYLVEDFNVGKLTDFDTVYEFGKKCDLVTIEIENVNSEALKALQKEGVSVYPQPDIIALIKNKVDQKNFYKANDIPTAPFEEVNCKGDVKALAHKLPFVNKLATEGYDGRGVQVIRTEGDLDKAFDVPGLVEDLIPFEKEISVIVARNIQGEIKSFPPVELVFHPEANLVEYLFAPAQITKEIAEKAEKVAKDVISKLNMVGLLAVEMFVTKDGEVLVNEVAPRTHNSGHQTIEANVTSQFRQHIRAILNLPLGSTDALVPSAMVNLLGEDGYTGVAKYEGMEKVMAVDGVHVHLYGKKLTKPFRKMGHITITDHDQSALKEKAKFVKKTLRVIA